MSWGCTQLALTVSEPRGEGTGTDKTVFDRVPCSWLGILVVSPLSQGRF